jgi:hypothetical protein
MGYHAELVSTSIPAGENIILSSKIVNTLHIIIII